jgi:hypothetical protein
MPNGSMFAGSQRSYPQAYLLRVALHVLAEWRELEASISQDRLNQPPASGAQV